MWAHVEAAASVRPHPRTAGAVMHRRPVPPPSIRMHDPTLVEHLPRSRLQRLEQLPGKHAIGPDAWLRPCDRPQIDAGPDELVCLVKHNPGRVSIEAQVPLHFLRHFHRSVRVTRRRRDRRDADTKALVGLPLQGKHDDTGPILARLRAGGVGLVAPQERVAND